MKKIIAGIMLLSMSLPALSQNHQLVIQSEAYPDKKLEIRCKDETCRWLKINSLIAHKDTLRKISLNEKIEKFDFEIYGLTKEVYQQGKRKLKEGYYVSGVLDMLVLLPISTAMTTAFLPIWGAVELASHSRLYTLREQKSATFILENFENGTTEVVVTHKKMEQLGSLINKIDYGIFEEHGECMIIQTSYFHSLVVKDQMSPFVDTRKEGEFEKLYSQYKKEINSGNCDS